MTQETALKILGIQYCLKYFSLAKTEALQSIFEEGLRQELEILSLKASH